MPDAFPAVHGDPEASEDLLDQASPPGRGTFFCLILNA